MFSWCTVSNCIVEVCHLMFSVCLSVPLITLIVYFLQKATLTNDTKDKEYTPHDLPQRQSVQPQETCSIARRAKRMRSEVSLFSSLMSSFQPWLIKMYCQRIQLIVFLQFQIPDISDLSSWLIWTVVDQLSGNVTTLSAIPRQPSDKTAYLLDIKTNLHFDCKAAAGRFSWHRRHGAVFHCTASVHKLDPCGGVIGKKPYLQHHHKSLKLWKATL